MASLFGIPAERMKVPKIVAGSAVVDMEIEAPSPCAGVVCGAHGFCYEGACKCEPGFKTPQSCRGGGDCTCSQQRCASDCLTCAAGDTSNCTSCAMPLPLLQPGTGRCKASCPSAFYADPSGVCLPCDPSCAECTGPGATSCSSCDPIGGASHLRAGACVDSCGDGYYAEDHPLVRTCQPCHASCQACTGPRASQCSRCRANACAKSNCPAALKPHRDGTSCVSACPVGRYATGRHLGSNVSECLACDSACGACTGPTNRHCTRCAPGASLSGGACVLPCADGLWPAGSAGQCADCTNYDCAACSPADGTTCHACRSGWIRPALLDGACVAACPALHFADTSGACAACDAACASCDGHGAESCTSCSAASPSGFAYQLGGRCLPECPAGYAADARKLCLPCDATCATCSAPHDAHNCTACSAAPSAIAPYLHGGACTAFCPAGEYGAPASATAPGACLRCPAGCAACSNRTACTACTGGLTLRAGVCSSPASRAAVSRTEGYEQLLGTAASIKVRVRVRVRVKGSNPNRNPNRNPNPDPNPNQELGR